MAKSLNPYSNGIWSTIAAEEAVNENPVEGLNPYSNGIWSTIPEQKEELVNYLSES